MKALDPLPHPAAGFATCVGVAAEARPGRAGQHSGGAGMGHSGRAGRRLIDAPSRGPIQPLPVRAGEA